MADSLTILNEKKTLRKGCLAARLALDENTRKQHEAAIAQKILTLLPKEGASVAGYVAVNGEVNILPLLAEYAQRLPCALPVIETEHAPLLFRAWSEDAMLINGLFNIPTPPQDASLCTPTIMLIPMVGFDRQRHRLGYGAGYYDRTLAHYRAQGHIVLTIGVAFSVQEVSAVPTSAHDIALDRIVTEKEII